MDADIRIQQGFLMGGRFPFGMQEGAFMTSDSAVDFEILHQKPNDIENKDIFDWIKMKKKYVCPRTENGLKAAKGETVWAQQ